MVDGLNHAILWRFNPPAEEDFTFHDFVKLVFHGDARLLLSRSQNAMAGNYVGMLDSELVEDEKRRIRYMGDPVKFAMAAQVLRNLPALSAVVPILIFSLLIATLVKLSLPFIRRWPILVDSWMPEEQSQGGWKFQSSRKRRDTGKADIPYYLYSIADKLENEGFENSINNLVSDKDEVRYVKKRSIRFASYNQRKARYQLGELTDFSQIFRDWLRTWIRFLPNIANCLGQLIGCHVQFSYWASLCKPIVPVASCVSIFGFSLESLAHFGYPF
eukprot:TRINITY_DN2594_c0_g1_i3.p1 TRINITY_DN2594_c0_g1~~TRINITY_DN2594_c0_g1_i3.p1  ORF type:complete len:283 (-),score=44.68 TRINITY_DN2594_c0_g1_i3:392-1210(-)